MDTSSRVEHGPLFALGWATTDKLGLNVDPVAKNIEKIPGAEKREMIEKGRESYKEEERERKT